MTTFIPIEKLVEKRKCAKHEEILSKIVVHKVFCDSCNLDLFFAFMMKVIIKIVFVLFVGKVTKLQKFQKFSQFKIESDKN